MLNIKTGLWLLLVVVIVLLDHWTKIKANTELVYDMPVEVLPFFNLTLLHNTGAAFSFLAGQDGWQRWFFIGISSAVSLALMVWLLRLRGEKVLLAASLALILGGALGNLWDRITLGYVIDFISLHYQGWFFPAFNIADSAITLGAGLMILDMFVNPEND